MSIYSTDEAGKVQFAVELPGGSTMSFAVAGNADGAFSPNSEVEIDDTVLAGVQAKLGSAFGVEQVAVSVSAA